MGDMVHPAERMPDGTSRSGLSVGVVTEIVRERADAVVEVESLRKQLAGAVEALERVVEIAIRREDEDDLMSAGWVRAEAQAILDRLGAA